MHHIFLGQSKRKLHYQRKIMFHKFTDKEPIKEQMPVKTNTFVFPNRGAKWNINTITITTTDATYSKNALQ